MSAREEMLARIRTAHGVAPMPRPPVPRNYRRVDERSSADLVDLLCLRMAGVRFPEPARSALVSFLDDSGTPDVRLATNFRVDILTTLIFNSPQWMQR